MRLFSFSGGIVFLVVAGMLAGGLSFVQSGAAQAGTTSASRRVDAPELMLRLMNLVHSGKLIDRTDLPADPATEFVVVDLRAAQDFAQGHLPGAVNVQPEFLVAHLGAYVTDPQRAILLYGYSETQSLQSVMALRLFAYQKVLHLRGGWPVAQDSFQQISATS